MVRALGAGGALCPRRRRRAVLHHDSAPQRDRHAAHGTRVPGHDHGRADPLSPNERTKDALATGDRSRGNRDPDGGRASDQRRRTDPPESRPERLRRAHLALEGALGQHHHPSDETDGGVRRLGSRTVHHGRGALGGGAGDLRPALRRGPDLPRQAPRQLGPRPADRGVRSGGRLRGGGRGAVAHPLSADRRQHSASREAQARLPGGGDDTAGDDARRHRGRGPSRRPPLPRSRRLDGRASAHRASHPGHRRRDGRSGVRHRMREDHPCPRLQRLPGRRTSRAHADQRPHPRCADERQRTEAIPGARPLRGAGEDRRGSGGARPARAHRAAPDDGAPRRPLAGGDRALPHRSVVREGGAAGGAVDPRRRERRHPLRPRALGEDVLRMDAQHRRLVHQPADLVGTPDPRLVRRRRQRLRGP